VTQLERRQSWRYWRVLELGTEELGDRRCWGCPRPSRLPVHANRHPAVHTDRQRHGHVERLTIKTETRRRFVR